MDILEEGLGELVGWHDPDENRQWILENKPRQLIDKRTTVAEAVNRLVHDGDLIACFDRDIPEKVIREIAKRKPLRVVFRDSSFDGSPAKINVTEVFKLLAPDTRVKVI